MNREEIERLCNTSEIEFVQPNVAISRNVKNKCGNITRDGVTYPDIIELLTIDEIKRYTYGRQSTPQMLENFFPGFNDIFFVQTHQRGVRNSNGQYVERTVGFGMYYSRNNYTIEEDNHFYYVTTNYDLYIHDRMVNPRASMPAGTPQRTMFRVTQPLTEHEDLVVQNIIATEDQRLGTQEHYRRSQLYYPVSAHSTIRNHVVDNIYPGLKEHACDTSRSEIKHVPNALTVCSAIARDTRLIDGNSLLEATATRKYSWVDSSSAQLSLKGLLTNMSALTTEDFTGAARNSELEAQFRQETNRVTVRTDGSHHKKNEMMILEIMHMDADFDAWGRDISAQHRRSVWYAQVISTSESPGDLKAVLERHITDALPRPNIDLTRKVLMSERAAISSYPDEEVKIALGRLTSSNLTLVRVGDAQKSPKGSTLMDICQFGNGVYEAIVDRPMELVKGEAKIKLEPGTYVVCVEDIEDADFLWYTRLAAEDFSTIEIVEIHSRLNLVSESDSQVGASLSASDRRLNFNQSPGSTIRSTGRFGRRQITFDNVEED